MKIASKKKINIYRRKQKILVCFLEANLISSQTSPGISKSPTQDTHTIPPTDWISGPSDGPYHHGQCFCTSLTQAQRQ